MDHRTAGADAGDAKLLARVRALLAKAESTEYDEEAEALSAKAQELISRHCLDQLLAEADGVPRAGDAEVLARRIWIHPPYVFAEALLVQAVAEANGCRSVVSEKLGFATVVGQAGDLVAVDLLVTSLLVQAEAAVRRHGRQTDRSGELVPVLHRRAEQVQAATEALFPHLVTRGAAIRNAQGWAAGRAAADLARLDTAEQIAAAAS